MKKKNNKFDYLELVSRLKRFLDIFFKLGLGLLIIVGFISLISILSIIYIYYEPYREIISMCLKAIDLSLRIISVGVLGYYLFDIIESIIQKKRLNKYGIKKR